MTLIILKNGFKQEMRWNFPYWIGMEEPNIIWFFKAEGQCDTSVSRGRQRRKTEKLIVTDI